MFKWFYGLSGLNLCASFDMSILISDKNRPSIRLKLIELRTFLDRLHLSEDKNGLRNRDPFIY